MSGPTLVPLIHEYSEGNSPQTAKNQIDAWTADPDNPRANQSNKTPINNWAINHSHESNSFVQLPE